MCCIRWRIRGSGNEEFPGISRTHRLDLELLVGLLVSQNHERDPGAGGRLAIRLDYLPAQEGSANGDRDANQAVHLREDRSCTVTDWELGFSGNYSWLVIVVLFVVKSLHLVDFERAIVFVQSRLHLNVMPLMLPHHF